MYNIKYINSGY